MARVFADYKYETDAGLVLFTRMSIAAKNAIAANVEPAGNVDLNVRVSAGAGGRENGIRSRRIILTRSVGAGADETVFTSQLVKLTPGSNIAVGSDVNIGGVMWKVASIQAEQVDTPRFIGGAAAPPPAP